MHPIQIPSGNAVADRRADYARMLAEGGDYTAAAELMEQALELAPQWVGGWFLLGDYCVKAGNSDAGAAAYRQVLALNPSDMFAASLKLALMGADAVPQQPPSHYVEALFDDYANRFETSLVEKLEYRVPQKLMAMMADSLGADMHFRCAVDLGCGTGLMGVELKPYVDHLEGYDLSSGMLAKAAGKNIYDHLTEADLSLGADACGLFLQGRASARADLITAADVLIYLGALSGVFSLAADLNAPGGYFVFSTERQSAHDGFSLASSLRYQHSHSYVESELSKAGFKLLKSQSTTIRMDGGKPIPGFLFIAKKRL